MDFTGIDVVALGTAIGSVITAMKGTKKAESETARIVKEREATKRLRDAEFQSMKTQIAVIEKENEHLSKRLDEGNDRFERLEMKLDDVVKRQSETNSLLSKLIGKVEANYGGK